MGETRAIELYRALVPAGKLVNDNYGQHYRTIQGAQAWLTEQYMAIKRGYMDVTEGRGKNAHTVRVDYHAPCGFVLPSVEEVRDFVHGETVVLHHEVWKLGDRRFDPHNYAHTFKTPLDLLVSDGYLEDDSWQYVQRTEFVGGGYRVWDRALRLPNDGLPDEFTLEWWRSMNAENTDTLLRTLIYKTEN